jgi:hypothetical protein
MLAATPQPVSSRIRRVGLMEPGADAGDAQRWLARRRDCRASQAVTARTGTSRPGGPLPEGRSEASQVTGGDRRCRHGRVLCSRRPRARCATTPDGRNLVVGGLLFIAHRTMINSSAPCAAHLSRSVLAWLAPTGVDPPCRILVCDGRASSRPTTRVIACSGQHPGRGGRPAASFAAKPDGSRQSRRTPPGGLIVHGAVQWNGPWLASSPLACR